MNRTTLLASGAALTLVAGTTFAAVGVASASGKTHTLVLHGTTLSTHEIGKSHEVEANTLRKGGKIVGYSTDSCDFGGTKDKCAVTYALEGGDLLGHVTFPITSGQSSTATGKITGGLGSFTGARGTIKVQTGGPNAGTITLKYTG
jgi:hypothetical protein